MPIATTSETYDDMLLKTDDEQWMKTQAALSLNDVSVPPNIKGIT